MYQLSCNQQATHSHCKKEFKGLFCKIMLAKKRLQVKTAMGEKEPGICGEGRERAMGRGVCRVPVMCRGISLLSDPRCSSPMGLFMILAPLKVGVVCE